MVDGNLLPISTLMDRRVKQISKMFDPLGPALEPFRLLPASVPNDLKPQTEARERTPTPLSFLMPTD